MKRISCFSVLGSYSIGFELEKETTVPEFMEKLRSGGVRLERIKLREKADKAQRTVHGDEYGADELLRRFDEINGMAADIVYNICCKNGKKTFSVFMKNNTSKVSVLTDDYYFELAELVKDKGN